MALQLVHGKKIQEGTFGIINTMLVGTAWVARKTFKIVHQYENEVMWNKAIGKKGESDIRMKFIIGMFSTGKDELARPYFDMERAATSLYDVAVDKEGRLTGCPELSTPAKVETLISDLLTGLDFLHSTVGMLHNDIKPENILLKEDGVYAYCDFGFATPIKDAKKHSGTPFFAAPEHFDDSITSVGATSDVFSLGISLLTVFDAYNGVPLPTITFNANEHKVILEQKGSNARKAVERQIERQHCLAFFKRQFHAPTAVGRNLKPGIFRYQYAMIIAAMVQLFDRPECPQLLQMWRELMHHGGEEHRDEVFYDALPVESPLKEAMIEEVCMNLYEVEATIPAVATLQHEGLKSTTYHHELDKAKQGEILVKWCVPRGHEHIIKLAEKMLQHGRRTNYKRELDDKLLSAEERNMQLKLIHRPATLPSFHELFVLGFVCIDDHLRGKRGYIFKSLTKRGDDWWKKSSKKTLAHHLDGMEEFHRHYLETKNHNAVGFAERLKRKPLPQIDSGNDAGRNIKMCKLSEYKNDEV